MFDREISYYNVVVCNTISGKCNTKKFHTEESAIAYAREKFKEGYRVKVEQINNITDWWK